MKMVFALVLLVSNAPLANACPELSGEYVCNYANGPTTVTYSTAKQNGTVVYTSDGTTFQADGVVRDYSQAGQYKLIMAVACGGNQVRVQQQYSETTMFDQIGQQACQSTIKQVDIQTDFVLEGNTIQETTMANFHCANGQVVPNQQNFVCTKK